MHQGRADQTSAVVADNHSDKLLGFGTRNECRWSNFQFKSVEPRFLENILDRLVIKQPSDNSVDLASKPVSHLVVGFYRKIGKRITLEVFHYYSDHPFRLAETETGGETDGCVIT